MNPSTQHITKGVVVTAPAVSPVFSPRRTVLAAYVELCKPRITRTVVVTAFLGYYLATEATLGSWENLSACLLLLLATACVCAGVCVFNHIQERGHDAAMNRTQTRPLPAGQLSVRAAVFLGSTLVLMGLMLMWSLFSWQLALGALGTGVLYNVVYTPFKRLSAWNTTIGALPGALPVLGGSVAAAGLITMPALIAFSVVFLWQHPHFYAIAWIYRDDYAQAGYKMLSADDPHGKRSFGVSLLIMLLLIPVTLSFPLIMDSLGAIYSVINIGLGIWFFTTILRAFRHPRTRFAQHVVTHSVMYLMGWMIAVIADDIIAF